MNEIRILSIIYLTCKLYSNNLYLRYCGGLLWIGIKICCVWWYIWFVCKIHTKIVFLLLLFFAALILELIPRPARACADPPLYLRLRMGKPVGKSMPLPSNVVMSYGKNKLRPEFWFSIPKNRIDELYRFLNTWVPHLYGELDEEQIIKRGYELIQNDTDWVKSGQNKVRSSLNSFGPWMWRMRTMKIANN